MGWKDDQHRATAQRVLSQRLLTTLCEWRAHIGWDPPPRPDVEPPWANEKEEERERQANPKAHFLKGRDYFQARFGPTDHLLAEWDESLSNNEERGRNGMLWINAEVCALLRRIAGKATSDEDGLRAAYKADWEEFKSGQDKNRLWRHWGLTGPPLKGGLTNFIPPTYLVISSFLWKHDRELLTWQRRVNSAYQSPSLTRSFLENIDRTVLTAGRRAETDGLQIKLFAERGELLAEIDTQSINDAVLRETFAVYMREHASDAKALNVAQGLVRYVARELYALHVANAQHTTIRWTGGKQQLCAMLDVHKRDWAYVEHLLTFLQRATLRNRDGSFIHGGLLTYHIDETGTGSHKRSECYINLDPIWSPWNSRRKGRTSATVNIPIPPAAPVHSKRFTGQLRAFQIGIMQLLSDARIEIGQYGGAAISDDTLIKCGARYGLSEATVKGAMAYWTEGDAQWLEHGYGARLMLAKTPGPAIPISDRTGLLEARVALLAQGKRSLKASNHGKRPRRKKKSI